MSNRSRVLIGLMALLAGLSACGDDDDDDDDHDAGRDADGGSDAEVDAETDGGGPSYTTETRTLVSRGVEWSYELVRPSSGTAGLPLVIGLHPDGGTGPGLHEQLMLESAATRPMVFAYPTAAAGMFEYYTIAGREAAAQLVLDLITELSADLSVDPSRVFAAGYSGGATMVNAIQCHLPANTLHGVGVYAGTLYPQDDPPGSGNDVDFTYTASGGVSCPLAPVIFVWGTLDESDVSFVAGQATRDNYRATFGCEASAESAWTRDPCVTYAGCSSQVVWCPVEGFAHAPPWPGAGGVIQAFFESL